MPEYLANSSRERYSGQGRGGAAAPGSRARTLTRRRSTSPQRAANSSGVASPSLSGSATTDARVRLRMPSPGSQGGSQAAYVPTCTRMHGETGKHGEIPALDGLPRSTLRV